MRNGIALCYPDLFDVMRGTAQIMLFAIAFGFMRWTFAFQADVFVWRGGQVEVLLQTSRRRPLRARSGELNIVKRYLRF